MILLGTGLSSALSVGHREGMIGYLLQCRLPCHACGSSSFEGRSFLARDTLTVRKVGYLLHEDTLLFAMPYMRYFEGRMFQARSVLTVYRVGYLLHYGALFFPC